MLSLEISPLAAANEMETERRVCESAFLDFAMNKIRWSCVDDKFCNCQFNSADSIILCREMKRYFG